MKPEEEKELEHWNSTDDRTGHTVFGSPPTRREGCTYSERGQKVCLPGKSNSLGVILHTEGPSLGNTREKYATINLLSQDIIEVGVQFYVVLLQITI